jgi:hypothetical protein
VIGLAVTASRWILAGNWKWAVPSALALVAVVYAGIQRINYLECKSDRAESIAQAEKALNEFKAKDHALAVKLVGEYAGEVAELQGKYEDAQIRLARTQSVAACGNTPAARAFIDGVHQLEREAGGGDAGRTGRVGAPVPTPADRPSGGR